MHPTACTLLIAVAVVLLAGCGGSNGGGSSICENAVALPTTTPGVQCCLYVDVIQCYPPEPPICGPGPTCPTPTPTPASGFAICGTAGERPGGNPPLARGVLHTLHPLELIDRSTHSGIFCFSNVPPGSYTITTVEYNGAPSNCTEYGCWQETPVTIVDMDVRYVFIEMVPLPTATPTPTADNGLHVSCPLTPGETTVVIDGTPFVVFARACTPTPAN